MAENNTAVEKFPKSKVFKKKKFLYLTTIVIIAILVGYIHSRYVSHLFENDRNFAYLSELEREMSFRTETGFYYSYYKTLVHEKPFVAGISKLMFDKHVEHPKEVNAFNRFNIHPEVIIAALYRYFEVYLNTTDHRQCHIIDRGHDMSPVESCIGLGQPIYFYLEAIWWLAGLNVSALFLFATSLRLSGWALCPVYEWLPRGTWSLTIGALLCSLVCRLVFAGVRKIGAAETKRQKTSF